MIHVIDKASIGKVHIMYNTSILHLLRIAFPEQKIRFYAEIEHLSIVKEKVRHLSNIETIAIPLVSSQTANPLKKVWQLTKKIRSDRNFFKTLLKKTEKASGDWIFLCTASTLSFLFLTKLKNRFPVTRIVATLHGEVEHVYFANNKREASIGRIYKKIISAPAPNIFYLVLNKISKQKMVDGGYLPAGKIIEMDHPYIFDSQIGPKQNQPGIALKVGHVGSLGIRKSAHLIYDLASILQTAIVDKELEIYSIGAIESNVLGYRNNWVRDGYDPATDNAIYLSRSVFEERISNLDYALFFYNEEQFIFRASGAIFDVITFTKPIIVLKHPYFDHLFKEAGNIGYICASIQEMAFLIGSLIAQKEQRREEYNIQIENIRQYQQKISVPVLAAEFKEQFEKLN